MFKIVGTVKEVKGHCGAKHKVGDILELGTINTGGLCGFFYHDIFPTIQTLQFGGTIPWTRDPDVVIVECPDRINAVTLILKRIRK